MTELDSALDLELTLNLTPLCEDDHNPIPGSEDFPDCGVWAHYRFHFRCRGTIMLVCTPLAMWALEPPVARCTSCNDLGCLEIVPL